VEGFFYVAVTEFAAIGRERRPMEGFFHVVALRKR
jgi:hypothetical protein